MKIGVPKEIKVQEYRVGLTPPPSGNSPTTATTHRRALCPASASATTTTPTAPPAHRSPRPRHPCSTRDLIGQVKEPQPAEIACSVAARCCSLPPPRRRQSPDEGLLRSGATCVARMLKNTTWTARSQTGQACARGVALRALPPRAGAL